MGIDGIGNKGRPPVPSPPAADPRAPAAGRQGVARPSEADHTFEVTKAGTVDGAHAPATTTAPAAATRGALERLRAGEIDGQGYVDAKVEEATAHLHLLPPTQLEAIRAALRDRMTSDPALVELLRTATGGMPVASSND